jgi:hypothetical protein
MYGSQVLGSIPELCNVHWSVVAILYSALGIFPLAFAFF